MTPPVSNDLARELLAQLIEAREENAVLRAELGGRPVGLSPLVPFLAPVSLPINQSQEQPREARVDHPSSLRLPVLCEVRSGEALGPQQGQPLPGQGAPLAPQRGALTVHRDLKPENVLPPDFEELYELRCLQKKAEGDPVRSHAAFRPVFVKDVQDQGHVDALRRDLRARKEAAARLVPASVLQAIPSSSAAVPQVELSRRKGERLEKLYQGLAPTQRQALDRRAEQEAGPWKFSRGARILTRRNELLEEIAGKGGP